MSAHVRAENLGKAYKRYRGRWDRLAERCGGGRERHELLWAVRGVGFEARPGESIGVIGVNGAGKSTLLRLIAGITRPTEGGVRIQGSVAALFELGMGFHPDFTGRQNIRMEARLLGLSGNEIRRRSAGIEEFSELGDDLDRPLRYYSSGMRLRLAFSVATAARPDILIVDEALAVGDIHFRIKCIERILEFKGRGTILLLVSHDIRELFRLCERGIFLDKGAVTADAGIRETLALYEARMQRQAHRAPRTLSIQGARESIRAKDAGGTGESPSHAMAEFLGSAGVRILAAEVLDEAGSRAGAVGSGSTVSFRIEIEFLEAYSDPAVEFRIRNELGNILFRTNTALLNTPIGPVKEKGIISVRFKFTANLSEGTYVISAYVANRCPEQMGLPQLLSSAHETKALKVLKDARADWDGVCNLFSSADVERVR